MPDDQRLWTLGFVRLGLAFKAPVDHSRFIVARAHSMTSNVPMLEHVDDPFTERWWPALVFRTLTFYALRRQFELNPSVEMHSFCVHSYECLVELVEEEVEATHPSLVSKYIAAFGVELPAFDNV
jgi:hypothetical protein